CHRARACARAARVVRRSVDRAAGEPACRAARARRSRICIRLHRPRSRVGVYNSALTFRELPIAARIHLIAVMCGGAAACLWSIRRGPFGRPGVLLLLAVASIAAHTLKTNLPLSTSSSTLSTGYAVGFAALLLFGAGPSVWTMAIGVAAPCLHSP